MSEEQLRATRYLIVFLGTALLAGSTGAAVQGCALYAAPSHPTQESESAEGLGDTTDSSKADPIGQRPDVTFHADGSVTIKKGSESRKLPGLKFRTEAPKLLQGSNEIILRLDPEVGSAFERLMQQRVPVLREAGVRKVTLKVTVDGNERTHSFELQDATLRDRLTDRRKEIRQAAAREALEKLSSEHGGHRSEALSAIRKAKNASFDKAPFLPVVRELIADGKHLVQSLGVLRIVGGDASDVPLVARYKDHEKQMVRASVGYVLIGLDRSTTNPITGETVLQLLNDRDPVVRTTTYKAMNGFATTPEIDARLIEMSARADSGQPSREAYDVVYYAMRSLPLMRKPIAERLVELIHPKSNLKYWAIWGLSRHKATEEARPLVVDTLINVIDAEVDSETRHAAMYGLKWHKTAAGTAKLHQILENPLESNQARKYAAQMLGKEFTPSKTATNTTEMEAPPGRDLKLWEKVVQPRDAKLRNAALATVTETLDAGTEVTAALEALGKSRMVDFDRKPFIPLVQRYLTHEDADVRSRAVYAFSGLGRGSISSKALLALLDDPDATVRGKAGQTAVTLDRNLEQPETSEIVRRLLNDSDKDAVQAIIYTLPGLPLSKEIEDRMIELSYDTKLGYDAVYYGLTNRPILRKPVAERLIELAQHSQDDNAGRAVWAMGRTPATGDARPLIVGALQAIVDSQSNGYQYDNARRGLKLHQQ